MTDARTSQRWVLLLMSSAALMVALDQLVVSTALTTMQRDLHASLETLEWTVNAYSLSFAVLLMTAAALGDRWGRRRMLVGGLYSRERRSMPSDLVAARDNEGFDVAAAWADSTWIQPLPDVATPEAIMLDRTGTRLAMVAALHTLSARERAAVILHDAVKLTSAEVAVAIDSTPAPVNSALQRARARLAEAHRRSHPAGQPAAPRRLDRDAAGPDLVPGQA